jgi:hypothetical protein
MATATTLIPIEEYLRTTHHPDRDYVDGEVQERNLGEREHGRLKAVLGAWFFGNEKAWNVYALFGPRARAARVMEDYARMGVPNLWLLDPIDRVAYIYSSDGILKLTTTRLTIPNSEIFVDLPELFAALD